MICVNHGTNNKMEIFFVEIEFFNLHFLVSGIFCLFTKTDFGYIIQKSDFGFWNLDLKQIEKEAAHAD